MATAIYGAGTGANCRLETDEPDVEAYLANLPAVEGTAFGIAAASKTGDGAWLVTPQAAWYIKTNLIPRHHTARWSA